ncbi:MAG: hypothetical protein J2P28_08010 [Actinobacteria bacterium]|nr:hypothetical protein [Actinomycetota bacterium]MBO0835449.1 hypothetical protein [Actinomycetota bacterium]
MERGVDVVGASPRGVHRRVCAEHVIVGQYVGEAQFLNSLSVSADGTAIGADLGLREYDAYLHESLSALPSPLAQH